MATKILPENNSLTVGSAISMLFYFHDQAHFNHLQTLSYARHKALNKFYDGLEEMKDVISELLLGYIAPRRIEKFEGISIKKEVTDEQLVEMVCRFADELYIMGETSKWWALSNKAAELSELGYRTKYLLTLNGDKKGQLPPYPGRE